jgi:hypothetical protein
MHEAAQFSPRIFKHRISFVRCNFPQRSIFQDAFECHRTGTSTSPDGEGDHRRNLFFDAPSYGRPAVSISFRAR